RSRFCWSWRAPRAPARAGGGAPRCSRRPRSGWWPCKPSARGARSSCRCDRRPPSVLVAPQVRASIEDGVDENLRNAVELFNAGRFSEFQDALEALTSTTRATSERQFYAVMDNLAEALLQVSDGDAADA